MNNKTAISAILVPIILAACTHETAFVTKNTADKPVEIPGVPFFVKKGMCEKESAWLEPQYTLSMSLSADGAPPVSRSMTLSLSGYSAPETQDLLNQIQGIAGKYKIAEVAPSFCPNVIGAKWDQVEARAGKVTPSLDTGGLQQAEKDKNIVLVVNAAKIVAVPDYATQYYLNTRSPWIGTAQVDAKLADDGTLSEGSAQRDDETWNTILTTVSSLVGDFTGAAAPAAAATAAAAAARAPIAPAPSCPVSGGWPGAKSEVKYTYALKTVTYRHDHKERTDFGASCAMGNDRVYGGDFTVSVDDGSDASKKSDAIQFKGEVKLPDAPKKGDSKPKG
jgi:hypothetical protein